MSHLYRTFTPDLEIRSRGQGGDGRTVVGIAVPYGRAQRIDASLTEQFAMGAFARQVDAIRSGKSHPARVPFTREHMSLGGVLIGKTVDLREDAAGLYGEWRVSATAAGDETLELLRDGVLTDLSIGFREGHNRRLANGVIERVTAHLSEVAAVLQGAYGEGALVSAVRAADDTAADAAERLAQARGILSKLPTLPPE